MTGMDDRKCKPYGPPMVPYRAWVAILALNAIALTLLVGTIAFWIVAR